MNTSYVMIKIVDEDVTRMVTVWLLNRVNVPPPDSVVDTVIGKSTDVVFLNIQNPPVVLFWAAGLVALCG